MLYSILFVLITICQGSFFLEVRYQESDCANQPNSIAFFSDANPSKLYEFYTQEWQYPICGLDPFEAPRRCCLSSLDAKSTGENNSAMYSSYDAIDSFNSSLIPIFDKDALFCALKPMDSNLKSQNIYEYYRANSICISGVKCSEDGLFTIYNADDLNCTSSVAESFQMTNQDTEMNSTIIGEFRGSIIKVSAGKMELNWVTYVPSGFLIPNYTKPLEIFGTVTLILALLVSSVSLFKLFRRYFKGQKKLITGITIQIMLIIWVVLSWIYWAVIFETDISWISVVGAIHFIHNIITFISVLETMKILSTATGANRKVLYIAATIVHLVLAGSDYFYYLEYVKNTGFPMIIFAWRYGYPFWCLFQYTINTAPPLYFYISLQNNIRKLRASKSSASRGINNSHLKTEKIPDISDNLPSERKKHVEFVLVMTMQVANSCAYFFLQYCIRYSEILGDDRNWLALTGPLCLADVIHISCHYVLMHQINSFYISQIRMLENQVKRAAEILSN